MNSRTGPIRVCFIAPKAYPLFNSEVKELFGGAEVDLYLLATELAKNGSFEISFITADYGQGDIETVDGVKIIKSLDFKKNSLSGAIRIWRAMRRADADIYLLKTASPGTPLVALYCLLRGKVFVYRAASARECDGTYLKEHYLLGKAFKWSLGKARLVFAQNDLDRQNLLETVGVWATVIPNGHRLKGFASVERDAILWVGRSASVKRPELFIEIAKRIPAEKFTMICQRATGDERYEELVAQAKIVDNLEFVERVAFDEITGYFEGAKVFVNTSESEGFANTFIQACSCAAPILSLSINPDGFLDKYDCGLCCDGDLDKLVEALKDMLAKKSYVELGKNGRKYVQEHHDLTRIVERYKELFTQVLRNSSRGLRVRGKKYV